MKHLQDGFSHPLYSRLAYTNRVLLQVKRKKGADGKEIFHVCVVSRVPVTHEFSGLADFQVPFMLLFHRVPDAVRSHVELVMLQTGSGGFACSDATLIPVPLLKYKFVW